MTLLIILVMYNIVNLTIFPDQMPIADHMLLLFRHKKSNQLKFCSIYKSFNPLYENVS